MGLFDQFPYTNFHELNMEWILKTLKYIEDTMEQFVSLNTIKYADPIQWDITTQYAKNTIVVDPATGNAYLSTQPVPVGVTIDNTDYWTLVFNYRQNYVDMMSSIASYEEGDTATVYHAENSLVWVNDTLYACSANIEVSQAFVEGTNIAPVNVNDFILFYWDVFKRIVGAFDLHTLTNYDNNYLAGTWVFWHDLLYRITTDVSQGTSIIEGVNIELLKLVNVNDERISAEVNLQNQIGSLASLSTADKTSLVNAINEVWTDAGLISSAMGDLTDLFTTDKSSMVNAINEVYSAVSTEVTNRVNDVNDLRSKIDIESYIFSNRNALFVGDSYGEIIGDITTPFPDIVGSRLGFNSYSNLAVGGAGFYSSGNPIYYFQTQLENYSGDRNTITDIFVIGGQNDAQASSSGDPYYTNVINNMYAFNTYAKNNYPNAKIHLGFIGNRRDSTDLADPRTYLSRKIVMELYGNMATILNWKLLPNIESCLCIYDGYLSTDNIHPNQMGSNMIADAVCDAIISGTASNLAVDTDTITAGSYPIISGAGKFSMFNNQATIKIEDIHLAVTSQTLTEHITLLTLTRCWFNNPVYVDSFIRLYDIQIGDVIFPCRYEFIDNTLKVRIYAMLNDGNQASYYNSLVFGANGFIEIPSFTVTFDSLDLA